MELERSLIFPGKRRKIKLYIWVLDKVSSFKKLEPEELAMFCLVFALEKTFFRNRSAFVIFG